MKLTTIANLTLCLDNWKGERKEIHGEKKLGFSSLVEDGKKDGDAWSEFLLGSTNASYAIKLEQLLIHYNTLILINYQI